MHHLVLRIIFLLSLCCTALTACETPQTQNSIAVKDTSAIASSTNKSHAAFKDGNYTEVKKILGELISSQATSIDQHTLFIYAESLRLTNESIKALRYYEDILNKDKDNVEVLEGMSLAYLSLGKNKKAIELLDKVITIDATRWRAINAIGIILSLENRNTEAIDYFETAINLHTDNTTVLNNIGLSLALSGESEKAIDMLNNAASLTKNNEKIKHIELNLALAYALTGNNTKAEHIMLKHLSQSATFNNLGVFAHLRDEHKLAKTYLSKSLTSSPVYYKKAWNNLEKVDKVIYQE